MRRKEGKTKREEDEKGEINREKMDRVIRKLKEEKLAGGDDSPPLYLP